MVELSRRFFLGGAISLIAATTFKPSMAALGNMPTIYGDRKNDDTYGLGALFRNEPVIFKKDQIGIDSHQGLTFHKGQFIISNTVNIPADAKIDIQFAEFNGIRLPDGFAFFHCENAKDARQFTNNYNPKQGLKVVFTIERGHVGQFVTYTDEYDEYVERLDRKYL